MSFDLEKGTVLKVKKAFKTNDSKGRRVKIPEGAILKVVSRYGIMVPGWADYIWNKKRFVGWAPYLWENTKPIKKKKELE